MLLNIFFSDEWKEMSPISYPVKVISTEIRDAPCFKIVLFHMFSDGSIPQRPTQQRCVE